MAGSLSRAKLAKRQRDGEAAVDRWNDAHPVGTAVLYWPVLPASPGEQPRATRTRSQAWALGHGEPVVKVEGIAGCVALSHLELDTAAEPSPPAAA